MTGLDRGEKGRESRKEESGGHASKGLKDVLEPSVDLYVGWKGRKRGHICERKGDERRMREY